MGKESIEIHTKMDAEAFSAFSVFHTFRFHKWDLRLLLCTVGMTALALVQLYTGGVVLFWVFLCVGILFPIAFFIYFSQSMRGQIKTSKLDKPRFVYSVQLAPGEVRVRNDAEQAAFQWEELHRVYLLPEYAYLYVSKARAFILPYRDIANGSGEKLCRIVKENLPPERLVNKRKS